MLAITESAGAWIGATDAVSEGTWMWSDGTPWDYQTWAGGQPDDWDGNEDCALMWASGAWNDGQCSDSDRGAVCRVPSPSSPPSSPAPAPSLSPPVASCPGGTSSVPVQLFTQTWASEISFEIDGVTITSGTLGDSQTYTYSRCLAPGSHTLLLLDSFGDGWHGGYVRINNVNYGTTFESGASMTFTFNV